MTGRVPARGGVYYAPSRTGPRRSRSTSESRFPRDRRTRNQGGPWCARRDRTIPTRRRGRTASPSRPDAPRAGAVARPPERPPPRKSCTSPPLPSWCRACPRRLHAPRQHARPVISRIPEPRPVRKRIRGAREAPPRVLDACLVLWYQHTMLPHVGILHWTVLREHHRTRSSA